MNDSRIALTAEWVTSLEAGDYLGVSVQTIRKWITEKRLDGRKLGYRTVRVSAVSVEKMLERLKT